MDKSQIIAAALTVLFVFGLVLLRLTWAASQLGAGVGLGRFPRFPKKLRRWLFGEHAHASN
jgi:hypothetical protein